MKEPSTFKEANEKEWRKVMQKEIQALKQNQTWPKLNNVKPILASGSTK